MRDDPSGIALVTRAAGDDQQAWDELVERYAPLVLAICTRYRLSNHDIDDVGQSVWLLLVAQLGKLPESAALPGGSIGPQRAGCLEQLRQSPALTAFGKSEFSISSPGGGHGAC
jgi:Sigma-70 region 2